MKGGHRMVKDDETETIPYEQESFYGQHAVCFLYTAYVSTTNDDRIEHIPQEKSDYDQN